jgi:hypothetical protein
MSVTERMQALGEHAKSSRQPPLKERKHAKASESAAKTVDLDDIFDNGAAPESAAAVLVEDATPKVVVEAKPAPADDSATPAEVIQEDADISAAKHAIIHEWENWSALHSDELDDPNVGEYFLDHLRRRKPQLFSLPTQAERSEVIRKLVAKRTA